jgi:NAD(P)-dependent dehydrogenase (short-subunit alcohol dehydrogenase family)
MLNYLIIGASSGIGNTLANMLASNGNRVYGTFNKNEAISSNSLLTFHPLNVLDENIDTTFLPSVLHGIVFCPGSINLKPFTRIPPQDFINDFNLQVVGAIKTIQMVLPNLKAADAASIVLYSSVAVQTGLNFHAQVSTSKGAIEGLTKALAAEFAPKIRVNCVAPSLTDTPLANMLLNSDVKKEANAQKHPLKRVGTTQDIANITEFLLSQKSSWITGQILNVDGGISTIKL